MREEGWGQVSARDSICGGEVCPRSSAAERRQQSVMLACPRVTLRSVGGVHSMRWYEISMRPIAGWAICWMKDREEGERILVREES